MKNVTTLRSPRLQATLAALKVPGGVTTRDLARETGSCAVAADVADLRANGLKVSCRLERVTGAGQKVFRYSLDGGSDAA